MQTEGLDSQGSIDSRETRPGCFLPSLTVYLRQFSARECGMFSLSHPSVDGRGKTVKQSWLAQTRSAALQIQICMEIPWNNSSRIEELIGLWLLAPACVMEHTSVYTHSPQALIAHALRLCSVWSRKSLFYNSHLQRCHSRPSKVDSGREKARCIIINCALL